MSIGELQVLGSVFCPKKKALLKRKDNGKRMALALQRENQTIRKHICENKYALKCNLVQTRASEICIAYLETLIMNL